jgi:hypothetical protein
LSATKLTIFALIIAAMVVVVALRDDSDDGVRTRPPSPTRGTSPTPTSLSSARAPTVASNGSAVALTPGEFLSVEPTYAQPAQVESLVLQIIARQQGLAAGGLSVNCDAARCEITLQGRQVNPVRVSEYGHLLDEVFAESGGDFRILAGSMGTREIAPSAREYVLGFEYQPYQDLSDDPTIAARQQAACAAAWRRSTENPTPDDVARYYLEQEDRWLALAAAVLGQAEAERVEAERLTMRGGPLLRGCD